MVHFDKAFFAYFSSATANGAAAFLLLPLHVPISFSSFRLDCKKALPVFNSLSFTRLY